MIWHMFNVPDAHPPCLRLHLLTDNSEYAESLGFVEQRTDRFRAQLIAVCNRNCASVEVPDIETGMAIVLMNVKGNDGNT